MARKRLLPRSVVPRTLRGRLIAGLVGLLAICCATIGFVTYLAVDRALTDEFNNNLQTATGLAYKCWEQQFAIASGEEQGNNNPGQGEGNSGQGNGQQPANPSSSASNGTDSLSTGIVTSCTGLAEKTFVAVHLQSPWSDVVHEQWPRALFGSPYFSLSKQDQERLSSIKPWRAASHNECGNHSLPNVPFPTSTRYLSYPHGIFLITAIFDPDCDSSVYYTGIPLAGLHDLLTDVALAEIAVFACVIALAGVLGTFWVRFSLRPLRRVATTASHVAELPLESGEVSLPAGVPDTDPATETGQVGLAFNRMLGHVENALRRRAASEARLRRFAADASHELRTPLAAIRGYAELALLQRGDAPGEVTHALDRVLSESTRMSVLVDDLLLLARLDAGRPLNREPVDMTRLAIDATSDAQVARPSHRWVLELPDDPELVLGDEHRLRQVLGNLLSNAWRHTPEGTTVTVRVSGTLPEGEQGAGAGLVVHGTIPPAPRLVISVTDNGPGIPDDLLPDLFERFTRADTSRSHAVNASSTGLGLAIVDAVVAAHFGAVLVTSRPGFTRFTIVLARLSESPAPTQPTRASRRLPTPGAVPGRSPRRRSPRRRAEARELAPSRVNCRSMTVKSLLSRSAIPRTLRGRLIMGLVSLLAIACASVGIVTYLAVQGALARELNANLQSATGLAYNCWESQSDSSGTQPTGTQGTTADTHGGSGTAAGEHTGNGQDSHLSANKPGPSSGTATSSDLPTCQGLGERTFVAVVSSNNWDCDLVSVGQVQLTTADKKALLSIPPTPGNEVGQEAIPSTTRYLGYAHGTFELTAIQDPDGDGSVYIIGLPLNSMQDTLRDVALAEGVVFAAVLLLAGIFGFFWVRFSLRPLRRVAVTASQVAELPLEAGEVSLPAGVPDTDPATETGQVGLAFNRMLGHVETALRRRAASEARLRRFAADASHELRTPLAAIRGYAELALLRPGDAPGEVTHALGRVLSESTRMSVLVDDLLLLARLDAGRPLSREPVDMTRLAIDATSDAQVARPGHRWVLELPDDPELVLGDEHRLRQVLANLLSNAGRHTPDGTTVTVRVSDSLPAGEPFSGAGSIVHGTIPSAPRLVISVTDDGPGIPEELLPELFERFTRADTSRSHATNASSTGLGLAIVDAVVAAHQGAVLVTSQPGRTRFTIVLAQLNSGSPAPAEPTRTSRRLLSLRGGHRVGHLGIGQLGVSHLSVSRLSRGRGGG